jgi:hypothetical protein
MDFQTTSMCRFGKTSIGGVFAGYKLTSTFSLDDLRELLTISIECRELNGENVEQLLLS